MPGKLTTGGITSTYMRNFSRALESSGANNVRDDKYVSHYTDSARPTFPPVNTSVGLDSSVPVPNQSYMSTRDTKVNLSDRNLFCLATNDREAVVGGADHGLKVVSMSGTHPTVLRTLYSKNHGHSEWVTAVEYLADGRIVSGGMDSKICVWRGVTCKHLTAHAGSISQVQQIDPNYFVSSSYDRSLKVWDAVSLRTAASLHGHKAAVLDFVQPSLNSLASASRDGKVCVWDLSQGRLASQFDCHKGPVSCIEYLSDGRVITGGVDGNLCLIDPRIRDCITARELLGGSGISNITTCPSRASIAIASVDGNVAIIDTPVSVSPSRSWSEGDVNCIYSLKWLTANEIGIGTGDGHFIVHSISGNEGSKTKVDANAVRGIGRACGKLSLITDDGNFIQLTPS
jgi:WD40 repeat protein